MIYVYKKDKMLVKISDFQNTYLTITIRLQASLKTRLPKQDHLESSVCP